VLILRDVCDGLAYAHSQGIVHRDVKPDNVLLSGRHAMLTDFGVARAATEAAASPLAAGATVTLGTPAYMAPEQISGNAQVDQRADIYSVGVLAYELLVGRPPFEGATRQELLSAHLSAVPTPLATLRPDVPPPLAELVMKCLEKRPDDRWASADELVQRLEAIAAAKGVPSSSPPARSRWTRALAAAAVVVAVAAVALIVRQRASDASASWRTRWAGARIERLTDFPRSEVDAAISSDGRLAAFLADRDSVFDAFVTTIGSGQFLNLTGGRFPQLFNEDVRNVGFSAHDRDVWFRAGNIASPAGVSLVPARGGAVRPFLETAVMAVWSPDRSQIAYHEAIPGDPIYVADSGGGNARQIFIAPPGVHNHYLNWSPDGRYLYFSQGLPTDEMDIWRLASDGTGTPERITRHNSRVGYPVFLDDHTLFYTATADDGTGPWLYAIDLTDRIAQRVSTAVEHYISIAASGEISGQPRRLLATVSNPSAQLWSVPVTSGVASEQVATRVALPTERSAAPRFGPDSSIYYLASRGGADGLSRLSAGIARELWKPVQGAIVAPVAIAPNGRRVCFGVRREGRSSLHCANADGTDVRAVAESLDVRGAASWSPDGKWIAVAAREGAAVHVFKIPADGGPPVRLVDSVSSNPVWSPDGSFILYSGTPRARSAQLKAVTPDGQPFPLPALTVDRIGDSYRFLPDGKRLVVKLGGFRRQDFWLFDITSGQRRQLTSLQPGQSLHRFDVSPDGKRIVFERVRENSDVVLIELPPLGGR
jgi:Tol biopolymer transport system component